MLMPEYSWVDMMYLKIKLLVDTNELFLNQEEHILAVSEMNKRLEIFRRDSQKKEKNSQISAASVILTA